MELTASPQVLLADGVSRCTIRAAVSDAAGLPVEDGTLVSFYTSLGNIDTSATVQRGVAEASLVSSTQPGQAVVNASAGIAKAEITVTFSAQPVAKPKGAAVFSLEANYIAYYVDLHLFDALGNVRLTYRDIVISTPVSLRFAVGFQEVRARSGAVLETGNPEDKKAYHRLDTGGLNIVLGRGDDVMGYYQPKEGDYAVRRLQGHDLVTSPLPPGVEVPSDIFSYQDVEEIRASPLMIKAAKVFIYPGDRIVFKRAEFYLGSKIVMVLPYHIVALGYARRIPPHYLDFSTEGGIGLDLPFYYSVSATRTGILRVQRGLRSAYFGQRVGWGLGLDEQYGSYNERGVEGGLSVTGILRNDWGAVWQHRQRIGQDSFGYFTLGYPAHRMVYGNLSVYGQGTKFTRTLQTSYSRPVGGPDSYNTSASIRYFNRPLGRTSWSYFTAWDLRMARDFVTNRNALEQTSTLGIAARPVPLGGNGRLDVSADYGVSLSSTGDRHTQLQARANYRLTLGRGVASTLGYRYLERRGPLTFGGPTQQVTGSLNWGLTPTWMGFGSATYDLDNGSLFAFGEMSVGLGGDWRMDVRSHYQKYGPLSFVDNEVGLQTEIEGRGVALRWSQARHRVYFELLAN